MKESKRKRKLKSKRYFHKTNVKYVWNAEVINIEDKDGDIDTNI